MSRIKVTEHERKRLAQRRRALKLSKRKIAQALGMDPSTYGRLEDGATETVNELVLDAWRKAVQL